MATYPKLEEYYINEIPDYPNGEEMNQKYNYYVRYYQTNDSKQSFQQFLQAIASTGLRLKEVVFRQVPQYDQPSYFEYITIWEIHQTADFLLLENRIADALQSRRFNNK